MKRLALVMTAVGVAALCAGGCGCESIQKQNQELTLRVAELEDQLEQAEAIISAAAANAQAPAGEFVYIVIQGDSLWSIAEKQLGSGARYKEILALNPHLTKDKPLAIGTKLNMPPQ